MNLLVDIGNSYFKWCFSNGEKIKNVQSFQYSVDSLDTILSSKLPSKQKLFEVESIFVCCVASDKIKSIFSNWAKTILTKSPLYFESSSSKLGVRNSYSEASNLGNDRWLSLVYVHHLYQTDVCIVDCGTAITIDVVLKNGQHVGGLIAPGYNVQITALSLKTNIARNKDFVNQKRSTLLQDSTHNGIEQGCREMSLGFINHVIAQLKTQYGDTLAVVVTGGDSKSLSSELPSNWHFEQDLLFNGLQYFSTHAKK